MSAFAGRSLVMGSQLVVAGPVALAHNRLLTLASVYASATNSAQWPAGAQPSALKLRPALESGEDYIYLNVTTNTSVASAIAGLGILKSIIVNEAGSATTIAVYDSLTTSGTLIGTFGTGQQIALPVNAVFQNGLSFTTAGTTAANLTLVYKKTQFLGLAAVNALNDATALAWLSQGGSQSVDVQYWPLFRDAVTKITMNYPITRCDLSSVYNGLPVFIGAN